MVKKCKFGLNVGYWSFYIKFLAFWRKRYESIVLVIKKFWKIFKIRDNKVRFLLKWDNWINEEYFLKWGDIGKLSRGWLL